MRCRPLVYVRSVARLNATLAILALFAGPSMLQAVQPDPLPEGWMVRADRPNADVSEIAFTDMPPGWHVTTGPAAILYRPDQRAGGEFVAEMEVYLFDPEARREAFGLFVGGSDLEGDGIHYVYFLIREGGEFLVKVRDGRNTSTLVEWTGHSAIRSFADLEEGDSSQLNVLRIEARESEVLFFANDQELTRIPRADLSLEGVVGMRVNHRLNLHISRLEVSPGDADDESHPDLRP